MRRLFAAFVAVALLLPALAAPVAAEGWCKFNHLPLDQTQQIFVVRESSIATAFDEVRGDATVVNLDPCIGVAGQGGTFVLPANLQAAWGAGPIVQLGYGEEVNENRYFYYVLMDAKAHRIDSPVPVVGERYRFIIFKDTNFKVRYKIIRLSDNVAIWQMTTLTTWPTLRLAWWGAERWEDQSDFGAQPNTTPKIDMAYMGYSFEGSGTIYYRTDLTSADVYNYSGDPNKHHLHIGTWVYGGDKINIESH